MGILTDKFKSNPIHQAIETTLKYIDDCKNADSLTDANRDSLDAYEQLLNYAKYVMENNLFLTIKTCVDFSTIPRNIGIHQKHPNRFHQNYRCTMDL